MIGLLNFRVALASLTIVVAACGGSSGNVDGDASSQPRQADTPAAGDQAAVTEPPEFEQALTLSPSESIADGEVLISSPVLGGWFTFELWNGTEWQPTVEALVIAEVNGNAFSIPLGGAANTEDAGWDSPVTVAIPADAQAVSYRLCSFSNDTRCRSLRVIG